MRQANTENVLNGIEKVNENVSRLDTDAVIKELNRLEALVSEINSNAVLAYEVIEACLIVGLCRTPVC